MGDEFATLRDVTPVIHAVAFLGRNAGGGERTSVGLDPSSHVIGRAVNHKKCRDAGAKKYLPLQGIKPRPSRPAY